MKTPSRDHRYNRQMLFSLLTAQGQAASLWMVLLVTGPVPVPASEAAKRQAAHLDNFRRLSNEGKLALVGPTMEPKSDLRGILLIRAISKEAAEQELLPDPYYKERNLSFQIHEFFPLRGEFRTGVNQAQMSSVRLVRLQKTAKTPPPGAPEWSLTLTNQIAFFTRPECPFRLAGSLGQDAEGGFLCLFDSKDDQRAKAAAFRSPLVSSGFMKATVSPLFLAEGGMPQIP